MLAIAPALLGAIALGGVAVSARGAMQGAHPVAVVGVSMAVATAITMISVLVFAPGDIGEVPQAVLPWIVAAGVAQFIGGRSLGMVAIHYIGASRTSLFIAAQAPFAAFFAIAFTGETLRPLVIVGTVGVVIALMLASGDSLTQGWRADRRYLAGYLVGLVSGASMGAGTVLAKQSLGIYDSPLIITAVSMLVALVILSTPMGVAVVRNPAIREFDRKSMGFIVLCSLSTLTTITSQFFCGATGRHRGRRSSPGHHSAVDAAAVPHFHRPPGAKNAAADRRRAPGCGRRGGRGAGWTSVKAGITPSLTLSRRMREYLLLEESSR